MTLEQKQIYLESIQSKDKIVLELHNILTRDEILELRKECEFVGIPLPRNFYYDYQEQVWF